MRAVTRPRSSQFLTSDRTQHRRVHLLHLLHLLLRLLLHRQSQRRYTMSQYANEQQDALIPGRSSGPHQGGPRTCLGVASGGFTRAWHSHWTVLEWTDMCAVGVPVITLVSLERSGFVAERSWILLKLFRVALSGCGMPVACAFVY
jgi:hypothetical protein